MTKPPPGTRVDLDPNPPKYTTPVPRILPRDPRLPSDAADLLKPDAENRDTERAPTEDSGEHEVHDEDDDKTPIDTFVGIRNLGKQLHKKLDQVLTVSESAAAAARDSANQSVATRSEVRLLAAQMEEMKKEHNARLVRLELDRLWVPRLVSSAAMALAIVALVLSILALQHR